MSAFVGLLLVLPSGWAQTENDPPDATRPPDTTDAPAAPPDAPGPDEDATADDDAGDDDAWVEPPTEKEALVRVLLDRGIHLMAQGRWGDAKIAVVEALRQEPGPAQEDEALARLDEINRQLGIEDPSDDEILAPGAGLAGAEDGADAGATSGTDGGKTWTRPPTRLASKLTLMGYGGVLGFVAGMAANEPFDQRGDVRGASIYTGVLVGALGAGAGAWLVRAKRPTDGQVAAVAWSGIWAGTLLGFTRDLTTGVGDTTRTQTLRSLSLGSLVGTGLGVIYVENMDPSAGDVSLVNSAGLYGMTGGLLVGLTLDPVKTEAYSINALVGATGGLILGVVAANRWDVTRERMLWIDGGAALGALAPWLAYPLFEDRELGRRVLGGVSAAGLVAGAYVVWRLGLGSGRGAMAASGAGAETALVPGLVQRDGLGRWRVGVPGIRPLGRLPALDDGRPASGLLLDVAGGRF